MSLFYKQILRRNKLVRETKSKACHFNMSLVHMPRVRGLFQPQLVSHTRNVHWTVSCHDMVHLYENAVTIADSHFCAKSVWINSHYMGLCFIPDRVPRDLPLIWHDLPLSWRWAPSSSDAPTRCVLRAITLHKIGRSSSQLSSLDARGQGHVLIQPMAI